MSGRSSPPMGRRNAALGALNSIVTLAAWVVVYFIVTLSVWVVLSIAATGWKPIVVTGNSMEPSIRQGDILLLEDHPEQTLVGQRAVVTYRSVDADELITHRVFEVDIENGSYVTKGDANQAPDSAALYPEDVLGVGRIVVPLLGMPVVWLGANDYIPLVALAFTAMAGLSLVALQSRNSKSSRSSRQVKIRSTPAILAIRRARLLVGTLITFQFVFQLDRYETAISGLGRFELLTATLVGLLLADQVARQNLRSGSNSSRLTFFELAVDVAVVVLLVVATGQSRIGWLLMALPLVEAAVHFRLVGALNLWMTMTGLILVGRLSIMQRTNVPVGEIVAELEQLLDQLGALLLVAIPGAFLAEQLIGDVSEQQSATEHAVGRGLLLNQVSQIGREINRLGNDLFEGVTRAAGVLGFDVADVWMQLEDRSWSLLTVSAGGLARSLPAPPEWGSGMRPEDLMESEIIIDPLDPSGKDFAALEKHGYRQLLRFSVSDEGTDNHFAIRVAKEVNTASVPGSVEAFQLLVAQAVVALQNDQLVEQLQRLNEEMKYRADHDALTDLPNRSYFLRSLIDAVNRHGNEGPGPAVLFCDLNGFKNVNDTLGHEAGDELLVQVSQRLSQSIGELGLVARLGGDEFTVLLQSAGLKAAKAVADQIHRAIRAPYQLSQEQAEVGTSIGISLYESGISEEELLRRADVAMYEAKRFSEGVRTAVYSPSFESVLPTHGRLATQLKKSMSDGTLDIEYQPLVDRNGSFDAFEAQLIWDHPELGRISNPQVLEVVSGAGLTDGLVGWLLGKALSQMAWLQAESNQKLTVVVNIAAESIDSAELANMVTGAIGANVQDPRLLRLQTTDLALASIDDPLRWRSSLPQGVGLSIDRFGSDHSGGNSETGWDQGRGLAAQRFAPLGLDTVVLDPQLVQQGGRSSAARSKLEAAVTAGRSLNAMVVATGIEDKAHARLALDAGADRFQGVGVHRPMSILEIRELLATPKPPPIRRAAAR